MTHPDGLLEKAQKGENFEGSLYRRENRMRQKRTRTSAFFRLSIAGTLALGFLAMSPGAGVAEDLEKEVQTAGKDLSQSIQNGIRHTGDYLKSEDFHQTVQRMTRGAADALKKSGNWAGQKLDSIGATGSPKK